MQRSVDVYRQILNLQGATFSRVEHEEAMVATVYKATMPSGERFILKISERANDCLREAYFLKWLAGRLPAPKIIQVVEPSEKIHGAILMECLPGELLKKEELTEELAYEIGQCLARIHLNRLPHYGDPINASLSDDPRFYFTVKFEEELEESKLRLPLEFIAKLQRYYKENRDLLIAVDGPCLVHRDFRPGNIIVQHGKLSGIIDWASARASFAEEDFCSLEQAERQLQGGNKRSLLAGYASVRPVPNYSRLLPFLRVAKAIGIIGFTVKQGTWKNVHSRLYQENLRFLEFFFDALESKSFFLRFNR